MILLRCLIIVLSLGLACVASADEKTSYTVGTWKTAQTIQPFLYEQFSPKLKVDVRPFTNPGDQKAALLAGSLDMTGTTLALAIQAASRGEPIVLVASLCNKCSALVVRKDGGIKTTADLKGKRIAYVPGTMHEILLREVLKHAGLDPDKDVTLMRVDFFDMGTALAKGDIDAFLSGEPLPTLAVRQGVGDILAYPYFDDSIGPINAGMIVRRATLDEHPETVDALVAAHVKATQALQADKVLWLQEASNRFGVDHDVLQDASKNMELAWDMDEVFVRRLASLGAHMKALGMIDREPDYAKLVDSQFVAKHRSE